MYLKCTQTEERLLSHFLIDYDHQIKGVIDMFELETNKKIGEYIRHLIKQKYNSERKFCKDYLKLQGIPTSDEETRKMQNRFSQILNGRKAIQTYDLPFVTELLHVSCEEILTAGKCYVPISSHVTNYDVAFSKDPAKWKSYIDREDKLILNYDEYGKSVLDYAFEFKNYGLLKYLTDNGYIKFRDTADTGFRYNFGADTTIKRRDFSHTDTLEVELNYSDKLRMNMLSLAMENGDFSVLDMLRARETPMLHFATVYSSEPSKPENYDISNIIKSIASAPDKVIDYFSEEYSVSRNENTMPSSFLYQHIGAVIDDMIRNRDMRVKNVIEKATEHNKKAKELINNVYADAERNTVKLFNCTPEEAKRMICKFNSFYESCDVARVYCSNSSKYIVVNVIRAEVESSDVEIMDSLRKLNASYDAVRAVLGKEAL